MLPTNTRKTRPVHLRHDLSRRQPQLVLRPRDTTRLARPASTSGAHQTAAAPIRASVTTHRSNVLRTRYRSRNNREILPKLTHGTHALQVYGAAGVKPAQVGPQQARLPHGGVVDPYASWLSAGDNAWQMTAATLVGLMSIPALAVLYGGLVQKKWAMNTVLMVFATFCLVLITWVLWAFKMGFGTPLISTFVGDPRSVLGHAAEQGQANIPLLKGLMPDFKFPESSLVYFQFVFAAITPILFIGSVIGRISFKVWMIFVPLWITFAYAVNAFLLWGGGYWAGKGALDFSGGYVIHLAAGVSGFVAAAVVGPRLKRDRERAVPNNLMFVAVGAGILWLGWNGFNGGDPYFAGADAAAAVINTNLATAVAMMTWILIDMAFSHEKKATFLGGLNGMICGLVGITPAAGYVNGLGAIVIGLVCSSVVWVAWAYLPKYVWPFNRVDDALGVVYTHGIAGLFG